MSCELLYNLLVLNASSVLSRVSIRDGRSRGDCPTSPSAFTGRVSGTTGTGIAGASGTSPNVSTGGTPPPTVVSRGLPSGYTTSERAHMAGESGSSVVSAVWAVRRGGLFLSVCSWRSNCVRNCPYAGLFALISIPKLIANRLRICISSVSIIAGSSPCVIAISSGLRLLLLRFSIDFTRWCKYEYRA